jgi:transmembrane sensor
MNLNPESEASLDAKGAASPDAPIREAAADWIVRRDAGFAPGEEAAFRAWLESDPRHHAAWSRLAATWGALDGPRRAGLADWALHEIGGRLRRRQRRRWGGALGGLAALLLVGLLWRSHHHPNGAPSLSPTVVVSEPARQVLPDGSVVELKEGAAIAVDFSGPLRRVALQRGEALFQVAKNRQRPFVVEAAGWEVRAVGTEFSVAFGSDEVGVLVTEGRVAVNPAVAGQTAPALAPKPLAFLNAGHRLTMRTASDTIQVPAVLAVSASEMQERLAWLSTRLEFSNTPLAEAVALMNQHNRRQFVIEDPSLGGVRVSGFIRADNAEAFTRFLETGFEVQAERRGENEIVLRRTP